MSERDKATSKTWKTASEAYDAFHEAFAGSNQMLYEFATKGIYRDFVSVCFAFEHKIFCLIYGLLYHTAGETDSWCVAHVDS